MSEHERQVSQLRAEVEASQEITRHQLQRAARDMRAFEERIYGEIEERAQEIAYQWIEAIEERAEEVLQAKAAETALLMHPDAMRV